MIEGSCHCGAVRWSFAGDPGGATACNCTVCRRYGVLWAYGHADEDVHVIGETRFHRRRHAQGLMDAAEIVIGEVQRDSGFQVSIHSPVDFKLHHYRAAEMFDNPRAQA